MKFGLIYELQMQKPWEENQEYKTYHQALDQIELADKVGFDYVWEVEHHFLVEYSHSSAPARMHVDRGDPRPMCGRLPDPAIEK